MQKYNPIKRKSIMRYNPTKIKAQEKNEKKENGGFVNCQIR